MSSPYRKYAEGYPGSVEAEFGPSVSGFSRRYLLCLSPLILYAAVAALSEAVALPGISGWQIYLVALMLSSLVAWVLRSREALGPILFTLILPTLYAIAVKGGLSYLEVIPALSRAYSEVLEESALLSSAAAMILVEIYRRSIRYRIKDVGVEISGGILRRQEQVIPYNHIGRVVLERSIVGRLLNYGTIIILSTAEWGSEYYLRSIGGTFAAKGPLTLGAGYARILKEASRDPLKSLYGVKDPARIRSTIERMITAPYRAEIDQVRYLKKIKDLIEGQDE